MWVIQAAVETSMNLDHLAGLARAYGNTLSWTDLGQGHFGNRSNLGRFL
jgi:hypothetical protein